MQIPKEALLEIQQAALQAVEKDGFWVQLSISPILDKKGKRLREWDIKYQISKGKQQQDLGRSNNVQVLTGTK